MFGCGKSSNNGNPADTVVEKKRSEGVPKPTLEPTLPPSQKETVPNPPANGKPSSSCVVRYGYFPVSNIGNPFFYFF